MIATGSGILAIIFNASNEKTVKIFYLDSWGKSFFSASLAANFVATSLLALKIWQVHHNTGGCSCSISETVPYRLGRVFVDSGMLYSMTLLITLILFAWNSNGQYIMVDCVRHSLLLSIAIDDMGFNVSFVLACPNYLYRLLPNHHPSH